jgi:DNA-binding beta-propeller fold protein YncE
VIPAAAGLAQTLDLPTSKQLISPVPGGPQRLNSLPISMAVAPGGRYVVTLNAGYGTFESGYNQSLAVLDLATGQVADFPDARTPIHAKQTLYSGLAFSADGSHLYASLASLTHPAGNGNDQTGSAIAVYSFNNGKVQPERLIALPVVDLPTGRKTLLVGGKPGSKAVPYPAAVAVLNQAGREKLLVAENLSDDVVLLDALTGAVEKRFDLTESDAVPATYPVALAVAKDGKRAFVALWNASEIVELDLVKNAVGRKLALLKPQSTTAAGTHPCAFELAPDARTLYVALANRDAVAAVNVAAGQFAVRGYFDTRLPKQSYFGAEPVALALNADGSRLYVANAASDAVAVLNTAKLTAKLARQTMVEPDGFIPTEWMPISLAFTGGKLTIATDKGHGTGPNNFPQRVTEAQAKEAGARKSTYIASLLYGSLATVNAADVDQNLAAWTANVLEISSTYSTSSKKTAPTIRSSAIWPSMANRLAMATAA